MACSQLSIICVNMSLNVREYMCESMSVSLCVCVFKCVSGSVCVSVSVQLVPDFSAGICPLTLEPRALLIHEV